MAVQVVKGQVEHRLKTSEICRVDGDFGGKDHLASLTAAWSL